MPSRIFTGLIALAGAVNTAVAAPLFVQAPTSGLTSVVWEARIDRAECERAPCPGAALGTIARGTWIFDVSAGVNRKVAVQVDIPAIGFSASQGWFDGAFGVDSSTGVVSRFTAELFPFLGLSGGIGTEFADGLFILTTAGAELDGIPPWCGRSCRLFGEIRSARVVAIDEPNPWAFMALAGLVILLWRRRDPQFTRRSTSIASPLPS
jgi:hypothetical protein